MTPSPGEFEMVCEVALGYLEGRLERLVFPVGSCVASAIIIFISVQSCVFSKAAATVTEWFSHVNSTLLPRTNVPYISFFVVYSHSVPLGNLVFVSEES